MSSSPRDYFLDLTPGKLSGLRRTSDASGRFKVLALDQTGVFHRAFGHDPVRIGRAKLELTRALGPHASAVLLDVVTSARQALHSEALPRDVGLVVRLEKSGEAGEIAVEEPGWSVAKIKRMGGDAVKILVYMDVEDRRYTEAQMDFVERTSRACREEDVLLMAEALSFPRRERDEPDARSARYLERRGRNILKAAELIGPQADILKLEFPGEENLPALDRAASRPWVLLSAGADYAIFKKQVEGAGKAGASGMMAGRAIFKEWLDPASDHFQSDAFLSGEAVRRVRELAGIIDRGAVPWRARYGLTPEEMASRIALDWYAPGTKGTEAKGSMY
jgi:tagatose 1,6-diphosphate aldolase